VRDARRRWGLLALRVLTAAGLAVDAYVHFDLAGQYAANTGAISQGMLFRIQAGIAVVMALAVLAVANRVVHVVALLVAIGAFGAVVLYRYVDVGALGSTAGHVRPGLVPGEDRERGRRGDRGARCRCTHRRPAPNQDDDRYRPRRCRR
jgi:hypothetical protein